MALVTIVGFPSSGKSRRTSQLAEALPTLIPAHYSVSVVSDETLNISPSAYDDSRTEKPARGALFANVQRLLSPNRIVIVDAPNYIKGFRYQLYCAARELKIRVCTIFVVATADCCRQWNAERSDGRSYATETLENLFLRFEEPSSMVRWDSPLFTVLWDEDLPSEEIAAALTSGTIKPPNSGTVATAKAPSDALHVLEQTSTALVSAVLDAQTTHQAMGGKVVLPLTPPVKMTLPARILTVSELQRMKRQFVTIHKKAMTLGTIEKGAVDWAEDSVAVKFVTYLEENLKP
ncbi:unnamed protein product [Mycena citricolor]|uniref:Chromatin associated protein KTI12 n=1 Tax=Mycena citricolor TaxID=2018698 RepID=A0AAD2HTD6_9AGAR|nr:unnamed protein product [Mycena citricolor]